MKKSFAVMAALMMLGQSAPAAPSHQLGAGARVDEVDADGAAARAGIQPGDLIRAIGGTPINSYADIDPAMQSGGKRPLVVEVDRGGKIVRVRVTPQTDPTGSHKTLGISHVPEAPPAEKPRWNLVNAMFGNEPVQPSHTVPGAPAEPERKGPNDLYHIMFPDQQ